MATINLERHTTGASDRKARIKALANTATPIPITSDMEILAALQDTAGARKAHADIQLISSNRIVALLEIKSYNRPVPPPSEQIIEMLEHLRPREHEAILDVLKQKIEELEEHRWTALLNDPRSPDLLDHLADEARTEYEAGLTIEGGWDEP